jgi:hypothetical protein
VCVRTCAKNAIIRIGFRHRLYLHTPLRRPKSLIVRWALIVRPTRRSMRGSKTVKRLIAKRGVLIGPQAQKRRPGWTGVYDNRSHITSYSAGCYVSSMQKHVHIGSFPNPRAAAVAHDALLVITGKPPVNCTDEEYARMLCDLCAGESVDGFVHDMRHTKRTFVKRIDGADGAAQDPLRTTRSVLHAMADLFLHERDKPPPTRKRARVAERKPSPDNVVDSDADTPKNTVLRASSLSPPPLKKQRTKANLNEISFGAKRPRSVRLAKHAEVSGAASPAVEAAPAAHEIVAWPSFSQATNPINDLLFNPDLQDDSFIRMWRHALSRVHFERFVDSAYAFSD